MEENFDEDNSEVLAVDENELLKSIWFKPTKTLKAIVKYYPDKYVSILLILGGIVRAIDRASMRGMGDSMSTYGILLITITMGGLFGWMTYYLYAWGMSVTGNWLNGQAKPIEFRTIIAWALIPSISSLILLVPKVVIFGEDLFKSEPTDDSFITGIMWIVFGVIEITLGIWTLIILVKGVAFIQGFKVGKSILNLVLPGLVILVPLLIIALLLT